VVLSRRARTAPNRRPVAQLSLRHPRRRGARRPPSTAPGLGAAAKGGQGRP